MDKWDDIEDLVERWKKRFPEEFNENMEWVSERKAELAGNKYGEDSTGSLRAGMVIHPGLLFYLHKFYPDLFEDNKDVKQFVTRFKKFAITEKY